MNNFRYNGAFAMNNSIRVLTPTDWADYELLDSGDRSRLERFGRYFFIRPETQAVWDKTLGKDVWNRTDAVYERSETGGGHWIFKKKLPAVWEVSWKNIRFYVKPTGFKHMGVFPEQSKIWEIVTEKIAKENRPISLLNLFAYTGGTTLAAAAAGATVTHIDSAKDVLTWAHENAKLSGLDSKPVRWIPEDAVTFVKREIKRGKFYDAIVMDPPKFGRGAKNEVWKIEDDLSKLVELSKQLLSTKPSFFIINTYATSYSALTLSNLLSQSMKQYKGTVSSGELALKQSSNDLQVPQSIFGMWERL